MPKGAPPSIAPFRGCRHETSRPCSSSARCLRFPVATATAQFAKPDDAIKYRQSAFTVLTTHMGRLGAMARGDVPFDAAAAQASARVVDVVSHLPWDAFPPGSNTGAAKIKGDPWKDAATFTKLQGDLKAQTAKLPAAVATLDGLKAQVGATSRVCRECHESFRQVR
jgi:cytochrome c556